MSFLVQDNLQHLDSWHRKVTLWWVGWEESSQSTAFMVEHRYNYWKPSLLHYFCLNSSDIFHMHVKCCGVCPTDSSEAYILLHIHICCSKLETAPLFSSPVISFLHVSIILALFWTLLPPHHRKCLLKLWLPYELSMSIKYCLSQSLWKILSTFDFMETIDLVSWESCLRAVDLLASSWCICTNSILILPKNVVCAASISDWDSTIY